MAVIISDMNEVPMNCFECDLHNYHFCNLTGNCIESNIDDNTRSDDCPLKEVPSGKWIPQTKDKQVWKCSICGNGVCISEEYLHIHHKYCGQCGAKMVEEQTGENT